MSVEMTVHPEWGGHKSKSEFSHCLCHSALVLITTNRRGGDWTEEGVIVHFHLKCRSWMLKRLLKSNDGPVSLSGLCWVAQTTETHCLTFPGVLTETKVSEACFVWGLRFGSFPIPASSYDCLCTYFSLCQFLLPLGKTCSQGRRKAHEASVLHQVLQAAKER